jgi:hypothetical protein
MAKVGFRRYKHYSGPVVAGEQEIPVPSGEREEFCMDRQHWLTVKVETGATYGTVVMYDGTCVTAGPDQFILVYPRELANEDYNARDDQGPLTKFLRRLEPVSGLEMDIRALWELFREHNWYVSQDGVMRYYADAQVKVKARKLNVKAGDLVHGAVLRDTITPVSGTVPRRGKHWEQALRFAWAFHHVFANPNGWHTQDAFGQERMLKAYIRRRLKAPKNPTVAQAVYGRDPSSVRVSDVGQPLDLAMAIWYSNSVNAPAIAMRWLSAVVKQIDPKKKPEAFAKLLIKRLGTSTYGRWNADVKGGRYQRTRIHAIRSGMWDRSLFIGSKAIMPKDL